MNKKQAIRANQRGMVLVMALILLLVVTILGVAAVRMSVLNTQTAGNNTYSAFVFQGAESALDRSSSDLFNIRAAALNREGSVAVPASYFNPSEKVTNGATLDLSGSVSYQGTTDTLRPSSASSNINDARFEYQVFRVNGVSRLTSTSARATHTEGLSVPIPR